MRDITITCKKITVVFCESFLHLSASIVKYILSLPEFTLFLEKVVIDDEFFKLFN